MDVLALTKNVKILILRCLLYFNFGIVRSSTKTNTYIEKKEFWFGRMYNFGIRITIIIPEMQIPQFILNLPLYNSDIFIVYKYKKKQTLSACIHIKYNKSQN